MGLMEKLLPIPHPLNYDPSTEDPLYFYKNVAHPLIKSFIRLMHTGLRIDDTAVESLREIIDQTLVVVANKLKDNPIIQEFQQNQYEKNKKKLYIEQSKKCRTIDYYIKEYKNGSMEHRTILVNFILESNGKSIDKRQKWPIKDLKNYMEIYPFPLFKDIVSKNVDPDEEVVKEAMKEAASIKLELYNKSIMSKVEKATMSDLAPPFNPGSTKQKRELFEFIGIEPIKYSKQTGEASWGRDQIEELLKITSEKDEDLREILQTFIDFSYAGIIKSNFLEAFDSFTIDDVLHGNLKLLGAKSARPTSNSPNLLNAPSTGSIYAKPLKKCFIAPEGYLIWSIDFSALEDRVIANLSKDENKIAVFTEGIDGHSLGATYYFKSEVEQLLEHTITDHKQAAKELKQLVDNGNKEAKAIRQRGKPVTLTVAM